MTTPDGKDREEVHEDDVVLNAFLQFLEADIKNHPDNLTLLTKERLATWRSLGGDGAVDLNEPLPFEEN